MFWLALFFSLLFHSLLLLNYPDLHKNPSVNIPVTISANIMMEQKISPSILQEDLVAKPELAPTIPLPSKTIAEKKVLTKVIQKPKTPPLAKERVKKEIKKVNETKEIAQELKQKKKHQATQIVKNPTEKSQQQKSPVKALAAKNTKLTNIPVSRSVSSELLARQNIEQLKVTYRDILLKHIDFYKIYPKIAQRRRIEGKVRVDLKLSSRADISSLYLQHEASILKKATQKAIQRALPMPEIPAEISLPLQISFFMEYRLQ